MPGTKLSYIIPLKILTISFLPKKSKAFALCAGLVIGAEFRPPAPQKVLSSPILAFFSPVIQLQSGYDLQVEYLKNHKKNTFLFHKCTIPLCTGQIFFSKKLALYDGHVDKTGAKISHTLLCTAFLAKEKNPIGQGISQVVSWKRA